MNQEDDDIGDKKYDRDFNISSSIAGMYDQIPSVGDNYDMEDQGPSNVRTNVLMESSQEPRPVSYEEVSDDDETLREYNF
jgi:hypothetical protein